MRSRLRGPLESWQAAGALWGLGLRFRSQLVWGQVPCCHSIRDLMGDLTFLSLSFLILKAMLREYSRFLEHCMGACLQSPVLCTELWGNVSGMCVCAQVCA